MSDFEVVEVGSIKEIALSRALAREIDQVTRQFGDVLPENVQNAFLLLKEHYALQKQMQSM